VMGTTIQCTPTFQPTQPFNHRSVHAGELTPLVHTQQQVGYSSSNGHHHPGQITTMEPNTVQLHVSRFDLPMPSSR
jgi:hypothetical protein